MAYAKMPLVVQDYPVGYQSVNQAQDNLEAIRAAIVAEHTNADLIGNVGGGGAHTGQVIPRAVVELFFQRAGFGGVMLPAIRSSSPRITAVQRLATGVFSFSYSGSDGFYALAEPSDNGTNPNFIACESVPASTGVPAYITCKCFSLSAGDFVATDYPFFLAVYGPY
jgi:hypothetical protein